VLGEWVYKLRGGMPRKTYPLKHLDPCGKATIPSATLRYHGFNASRFRSQID